MRDTTNPDSCNNSNILLKKQIEDILDATHVFPYFPMIDYIDYVNETNRENPENPENPENYDYYPKQTKQQVCDEMKQWSKVELQQEMI